MISHISAYAAKSRYPLRDGRLFETTLALAKADMHRDAGSAPQHWPRLRNLNPTQRKSVDRVV